MYSSPLSSPHSQQLLSYSEDQKRWRLVPLCLCYSLKELSVELSGPKQCNKCVSVLVYVLAKAKDRDRVRSKRQYSR